MSSFVGVARWRVAAVALLATLLLGAAVGLALPGAATVADVLTGGAAQPAYDALLVALASAALLVAAPWCWLLVVLVCVDVVRGSDRRRRGCPAALRRTVLLAIGATTAVALAHPATAQSTRGEPAVADPVASQPVASQPVVGAAGAVAGGRAATPTADLLDGLPLPDRPDGVVPEVGPALAAAAGSAAVPHRGGPASPTDHVVVPGDDLWSIAAAHLPAAADDREVLEATLALHRANADVIGPDPDLILPGYHLDLRPLPRPSE